MESSRWFDFVGSAGEANRQTILPGPPKAVQRVNTSLHRDSANGPAGQLSASLSYVLITPARNEGDYIDRTLASVVAQSHLPLRWIVVSDGSTDRTDEVVSAYLRQYDWIQLVRMPIPRERTFAAKVMCFNAGLEVVRHLPFDVIGNLDADISFGPDYFEYLMARFAEAPQLGVAGTPFVERDTHYDYRFTSIEHVSGACQLFRRTCFEEIGGYIPIPGGGIDWVAVTTARMKGWQTRTFTGTQCIHHRPIGTGSASRLRAAFRQGRKDYYLGGHPLWEALRGLYQMTKRPYVVTGAALVAGYLWACLRRQAHPVSDDFVRFHRQEQLTRLRRFFRLRVQSETQ